MKFHYVYLCTALFVSSTFSSPVPHDPPFSETRSQAGGEEMVPETSSSSTFANLALAGVGTALLIGGGIGISEWALNWYNRLILDKNTRNQQNQTLHDENSRRQQQRNRRERAMNLILEMAESYSDKVASVQEFDGNFEPLVVPSSIVGAVKNVFEQTADVEGVEISHDRGHMESLEGLKDALKPVLEFYSENIGKKKIGY
jgi:hypothetical protein